MVKSKDKNDAKINVWHLAKLAGLQLSDNEQKILGEQLQETVNYIDILEELNVSSVKTTSQITSLANVNAEDKIVDGLDRDEVLANASKKINGYFETERVKWEE